MAYTSLLLEDHLDADCDPINGVVGVHMPSLQLNGTLVDDVEVWTALQDLHVITLSGTPPALLGMHPSIKQAIKQAIIHALPALTGCWGRGWRVKNGRLAGSSCRHAETAPLLGASKLCAHVLHVCSRT